jgi:hypothetical protein
MPTHASNDSVFSGYNVFLQSKDGVQDATHGPSKCDFYLDRIIKPERNDIGMLISVIDAEIPYSFYNVSQASGNNSLTINGVTYSLTDRNYNAYNVMDAFNDQFVTAGLNITMTFSDTTNKFTLVSTATPPTSFTIDSTTMVKELGAPNLPQSGTGYTSKNVANLAGTSSIYIQSSNMLLNNINSFGKTFNVLSKCLVNTSPSSFIYYQPSQPQYFQLNNALNFINIEMRNDSGEFVQFNGCEWSLTISIEFFRKREDYINSKWLMDYPGAKTVEEPAKEGAPEE